MDNFIKTEKIYTILELNNTVRRVLKLQFPDYIWVCGEIQDFKFSKDRRHIYFNLVQKHPELDEIIAQVSAKIFESYKIQIFKRLEEIDLSFELRNDIEVKVKCELDLYPRQGTFSLIVVDIDPIYTIGKLAQSKHRIIENLRSKGLLERNKSILFPVVPYRIGLITAYNSAAYWDFLDELKKSNYGFTVILYDCHMQGKFVEKDIISALNYFNRYNKDSLDVIIITRGGGSAADLGWFDNENIAKSIALSKFAVITALGHQINFTISDLVAHTSLKTPTKAAQFLIEKIRDFIQKLEDINKEIKYSAMDFIKLKKQILENFTIKLDSSIVRYFRFSRNELSNKKFNIINILKTFFILKEKVLNESFQSIKLYLVRFFKERKEKLKHQEDKINLLDPIRVLKRGYSITFKDTKPIKSIDNVNRDDIIKSVLYKGEIFSKVSSKKSG